MKRLFVAFAVLFSCSIASANDFFYWDNSGYIYSASVSPQGYGFAFDNRGGIYGWSAPSYPQLYQTPNYGYQSGYSYPTISPYSYSRPYTPIFNPAVQRPIQYRHRNFGF